MFKSPTLLKAGVVLMLFMSAVVGWHHLNDRPSSMDETKHMQLAMDYHDWLVHDVPLQNPWAHVYPPLYHFSIIPAMSLGVPTEAKAVLTHALYLIVFVIGCLFLGRADERSDDESLTAALLTVGYCYVLWAGRRALTDFPLMAWVMLGMGLLARTRGFESKKASVIWGVAVAIGTLLKFTYLFFFILPVLWTFGGSRANGRAKNLLLALGIVIILGGSWYFWNSAFFFDKAFGLVQEVTNAGTDPRTLAGWIFYLKLWSFQMGFPNMVFTAIGIVLALLSLIRRPREGDILLWMWFLSGYVILSAMMNKDPRHTLPMLPAVALLSVRGWGSILPKSWRAGALWSAAVLLFGYTVWTYDRPAKENWKIHEIGQWMSAHHDSSQPFLTASVLSHHPRFFARTLKWTLRADDLSIKTTGAGTPDASFSEFIILREGDQGSEGATIEKEWQDVEPKSRAFRTVFPPGVRYTLLDNSHVTIYQRIPHPRFDIPSLSSDAVAQRLTHSLARWVSGPLRVAVQSTPSGLREGRLERIIATCENCQVQGMTVHALELDIRRPWVNLYRLWDEDKIGLLAFESAHARLVLTEKDVIVPLSKIKGVTDPQVEFIDGKIKVRAHVHGIPVKAVVYPDILLIGQRRASATLETISLGGIPLPGWVIGTAHHQTLWFDPQPSFPGKILETRVSADHQKLILE